MAFRDWLKRLTTRSSEPGRHRRGKNAPKTDFGELQRKVEDRTRPERPAPPAPKPKLPPGPGIWDLPEVVATRAVVADTRRMGVDADPALNADELIGQVGAGVAHTIASEQRESSEAYANGNPGLGSDRFANQVERMEKLLGRKVDWEWFGDRKNPEKWRVAKGFMHWFFYHANKRM